MTQKKHWTTGTWHGLTVYYCSQCAFDARSETEIKRHWQERHVPRPIILVADSRGNEVENTILEELEETHEQAESDSE